jgi:hypothetical protein
MGVQVEKQYAWLKTSGGRDKCKDARLSWTMSRPHAN